eukprot:jgi/Chlat1/4999/Chrsp32S08948
MPCWLYSWFSSPVCMRPNSCATATRGRLHPLPPPPTFVVLDPASLGQPLHFHCRTCNASLTLAWRTGVPCAQWRSRAHVERAGLAEGEDMQKQQQLQQQQQQTQRRSRTSKYLGVCRSGHRWRVQLRVSKRPVYQGTYRDEKEAALAYDRAVTTRGLMDKRLNKVSFPDDFPGEAKNKEVPTVLSNASRGQHSMPSA